MSKEDAGFDLYEGLKDEEDFLYGDVSGNHAALNNGTLASNPELDLNQDVESQNEPTEPEQAEHEEQNDEALQPAPEYEEITPIPVQSYKFIPRVDSFAALKDVPMYVIPEDYKPLSENVVLQVNPSKTTGLYLCDLDFYTADSDIWSSVEACGVQTLTRIIDLTFFEVKSNGRSRGMAFLEFYDAESAARLALYFDEHKIRGVKPRVLFSPPGQFGNPFRQIPRDPKEQRMFHGNGFMGYPPRVLKHCKMEGNVSGTMFIPRRPQNAPDDRGPFEIHLTPDFENKLSSDRSFVDSDHPILSGVLQLPDKFDISFSTNIIPTSSLLEGHKVLVREEHQIFEESARSRAYYDPKPYPGYRANNNSVPINSSNSLYNSNKESHFANNISGHSSNEQRDPSRTRESFGGPKRAPSSDYSRNRRYRDPSYDRSSNGRYSHRERSPTRDSFRDHSRTRDSSRDARQSRKYREPNFSDSYADSRSESRDPGSKSLESADRYVRNSRPEPDRYAPQSTVKESRDARNDIKKARREHSPVDGRKRRRSSSRDSSYSRSSYKRERYRNSSSREYNHSSRSSRRSRSRDKSSSGRHNNYRKVSYN